MKRKSGTIAAAAACLGLAGFGAAWIQQHRARRSHRELERKVVLITGGSRGLGFALACEFAMQGARLALTSRNLGDLERAKSRLARDCRIVENDIFIQACDVGSPQEVSNWIDAAAGYFGRIDILVNNAGVIAVGPFSSLTPALFEEVMRVNFFGAVHSTFAVLPHMMARGEGAIVNIASVGGKVAFPHLLPYTASKFALAGWSQGLRTALASKNIRVTTVCPGVMRTGSHIQAQFTGDAQREYRWFGAAATFPGTATDAGVAAKQIVRALLRNYAEISVGMQSLAASRLGNVAPEWTAALLQLVNSFLPGGAAVERVRNGSADSAIAKPAATEPVPGSLFRHELPRLLERFGEEAIRRYNPALEDATGPSRDRER